jgi:hypothetical protein
VRRDQRRVYRISREENWCVLVHLASLSTVQAVDEVCSGRERESVCVCLEDVSLASSLFVAGGVAMTCRDSTSHRLRERKKKSNVLRYGLASNFLVLEY